MTWPDRVQVIFELLAKKFPELTDRTSDEKRRNFTMLFAQQCAHELGPNWGTKRADPDRPLASKVICTRSPFIGWEWDSPSGLAIFPQSIPLDGQVFVEVIPFDWLGAAVIVPPKPVDPPAPPSKEPPGGATTGLEVLEQLLAPFERIADGVEQSARSALAIEQALQGLQRDGITIKFKIGV